MSIASSSTTPAVCPDARTAPRSIFRCYYELTKARLSALVVMSTAVGFILADAVPFNWPLLIWTVLGTTLAAASASVFNQLIESPRDALMQRTKNRPLPTGAISAMHCYILALTTGYAGIAMLGVMVNLKAAALALATIIIYVLIYTPLKTRSSLNTLVGAICGAIPPMIGWVAARGTLDLGAWILGTILFVWQLPHFLSLAWLYREDYRKGGFAMLSLNDHNGELTGRVVLLTSLILLPLGLVVTLAGMAGIYFAIGSSLLGAWLIGLGLKLHAHRTNENARRVFLASILYLSLLMCMLVIDRGPVNSGISSGSHPTNASEVAKIATASQREDYVARD